MGCFQSCPKSEHEDSYSDYLQYLQSPINVSQNELKSRMLSERQQTVIDSDLYQGKRVEKSACATELITSKPRRIDRLQLPTERKSRVSPISVSVECIYR